MILTETHYIIRAMIYSWAKHSIHNIKNKLSHSQLKKKLIIYFIGVTLSEPM